MKKLILAISLLVNSISATAALREDKIATCTISDKSMKSVGTMTIFQSDNGDEGFLRFAFTLSTAKGVMNGEFTDNVQDQGAEFLNKGNKKLYVPLEGAKSIGPGKLTATAVYLVNNGKSIHGLFRADFIEGSLLCKTSTIAMPAHFAGNTPADENKIFVCAREAGIIATSEQNSCFSLVDDNGTVALSELHNKTCGGDPSTSPTRAFFSQKKIKGVLQLGYESGGSDWVPCH